MCTCISTENIKNVLTRVHEGNANPDDNLRGAEYAGVRADPYSRLVFFQIKLA
jgi:hypothetical protein